MSVPQTGPKPVAASAQNEEAIQGAKRKNKVIVVTSLFMILRSFITDLSSPIWAICGVP